MSCCCRAIVAAGCFLFFVCAFRTGLRVVLDTQFSFGRDLKKGGLEHGFLFASIANGARAAGGSGSRRNSTAATRCLLLCGQADHDNHSSLFQQTRHVVSDGSFQVHIGRCGGRDPCRQVTQRVKDGPKTYPNFLVVVGGGGKHFGTGRRGGAMCPSDGGQQRPQLIPKHVSQRGQPLFQFWNHCDQMRGDVAGCGDDGGGPRGSWIC